MNTKKRLSKDIQNTKEDLIEDRFVTLYQNEISHLQAKKEDLEIIGQLDDEELKEVEESARLYHRILARNFYEMSAGIVTEEEFYPLWEREEELKRDLQRISSMEGEQKQLEREMDIVIGEEDELVEKRKKAEDIRLNRKAVLLSFFLMTLVAVVIMAVAVVKLEFPIIEYILPVVTVIFIVLLLLITLYRLYKKAVESEKLYRMMATHKFNSRCRLESDFQNIGNDLKYYYEKYEILFGYISEEQWKLFEFCAKVSAGLKFSAELKEQSEVLKKVLQKHHLKEIDAWLYYPKALYEIPKRGAYVERLNNRQNICQDALERHQQKIDTRNNNE